MLLACICASGSVSAQEGLYVYASNLFSNDVSVYRTNADGTLTDVTTIDSVGTAPAGVAIRGDQAFMYVSGTNDDSLHVVDTRTNAVVQSIPTGTNGLNDPRDLAVSPDGKRLYVPNNGGNVDSVSVFTIDTLSGQLTAAGTIAVGRDPRAVVFSPDGTRAYVVNQDSSGGGVGSVSVIDVATSTVTPIATGGQLFDGAISPDGSRVYVSNVNNGGEVFVIDTATNTRVATIAVTNNPRGVAVNGDGTKLYVVQSNNHSVSVVDVATETIVATTAAGQAPNNLTLSPTGEFAYVASTNDDSIVKLNVAAGTGLLSDEVGIAAGDYPVDVIICQRGDALLASGNTFVAHTGAALGCTGASAEFMGGTLLVNGANLAFATPMSVGTGGGTIDTNGNDATISSVISGNAALTKVGIGTLTLTGTNTHTGTVDVDAGTVVVNGTLNSATIKVAAGATLDGSGVINGNVYLEQGATLGGVTVNGTLSGPGAPVVNAPVIDAPIVDVPVDAPVVPVHTVLQLMKGVVLQGIIDVMAGGIIDGGYLDGIVTSSGIIKGEIRLGPDTTITGGTLSGSIIGQASAPALIMADIAAGTLLQNVRILRGSRIDPGIRIGRNVVIEDAASIPAALDLTYAFDPAPGAGQHIPLLDAALDHPAGKLSTAGTVLADMQAAMDASPMTDATLDQNMRGELIARFDGLHSTLLPVQVRLADGSEHGIRVQDDGSVLFSLGWYAVLAVPAPADAALLAAILKESSLFIQPGDANGTALFVRSLNPMISAYFSFRPGLYAAPVANGEQAGLHSFLLPDMPASTGLALVFEDAASGSLRRQELLPVPADWQALKAHLATMPGIDAAGMGADGSITVTVSGQALRVRAGYRVVKGPGSGLPLVLTGAGDQNGDGLDDYRVVYPNGDSQLLYRLSQ
jgi:YVTN family beta-propeller protein/autotransporter-associated beta strand protein